MFGYKLVKTEDVEVLDRTIRLNLGLHQEMKGFLILANGCSAHPSYRGIRKPTGGCSICANIFAIRSDLAATYTCGFRSGKRGPNKSGE